MNTGKLLGIDHGIKRLGVAVCDGLRITTRELAIIERTTREADFERINALATQENVVGIVIGIPIDETLPDDEHSRADTVFLWAERLAATTDLQIDFWDEQNSSHEALAIAKHKKRKIHAHIDDLAARVILQRYIDAQRDGLVEDGI